MAVVVNGSAQYIKIDAAPAFSSNLTACGWFYFISGAPYQPALSWKTDSNDAGVYLSPTWESTSQGGVHDYDGSAETHVYFSSYTLNAGEWQFWAFTRQNNTASGLKAYYYRPATGAWSTATGTSRNLTTSGPVFLSGHDLWGDDSNHRVAGVKIWTAILTQAEIEAEMRRFAPVRTTDLWSFLPMVGQTTAQAYLDLSGSAHPWATAAGTPTIADGPPVSWGASPILVGKATATGPATITGTGALSSDEATIAGTAERAHTGTGSLSSQASTVAGTAERVITGSGALTSQAPSIAGTAERVLTATGALASAAASIAGTAERTLTATGALASQAATIAGTAERSVTGTGALTSAAATIAGTGAVGDVIVGSGALAAQDSTVAGTAERTLTGTGALTSQAATVAGTAEREITATGALSSQASSVAGTAEREVTGTGALTSAAATIAGDGLVVTSGTVVGTGALAANDATIAGDGTVIALPRSNAAGGKKRRRSRYIELPEDLEREEQEREAQEREAQEQTLQAKPEPKRARRTGKASRGIQLAPEPDLEAQRAAEILAQRTAELMAQQQAAQDAMRAEGMAMLQAAAQIEAENEMLMLLLMAA